GDVSAYIPTNVISITDGQIFLESDLFYQGVRPAVNAGISVSRVGGNAQTKAMKKVGGNLRISMAQYRELAAFAQFGSDLDASTQAQITRGERLVEVLKQKQYSPMSLPHQVLQLYAGSQGFLDDLPALLVTDFCAKLIDYADKSGQDVLHEIETKRELSDDLEKRMQALLTRFKEESAQTATPRKTEKV
ncbi:F0F1 ATP synthase subunit alpha, partial [bacterium]|nr:F0F1 ATP synthase subunit alpha [bacterium]